MDESGDADGIDGTGLSRHRAVPRTLYVVATPLGNLRDLTLRALDVLGSVDVIAAEDTRVTGVLLRHYGIATRPLSLHEHNEEARAAQIVANLGAGRSVALVSDAGTPAVSDPGARLVRAVRDAGLPVVPIPGANAAIAAVSAAGLDAERFLFLGFLPTVAKARRTLAGGRRPLPVALVIYEAPHRVRETVGAAARGAGRSTDARRRPRDHEEVRNDRAHAARRCARVVRRGCESRARRIRAARRRAAGRRRRRRWCSHRRAQAARGCWPSCRPRVPRASRPRRPGCRERALRAGAGAEDRQGMTAWPVRDTRPMAAPACVENRALAEPVAGGWEARLDLRFERRHARTVLAARRHVGPAAGAEAALSRRCRRLPGDRRASAGRHRCRRFSW